MVSFSGCLFLVNPSKYSKNNTGKNFVFFGILCWKKSPNQLYLGNYITYVDADVVHMGHCKKIVSIYFFKASVFRSK